MRFVVIGATGRTGKQVTAQALLRGHRVTAIVRNRSLEESQGLHQVIADPCRTEELTAAFAQQDAVISCLGQRAGGNPWLIRDATDATLHAMQQTGVKRLILVSGALLYPTWNPVALLLTRSMAGKLIDGRAAEDLTQNSQAEWTIVRPPRLTDGAENKGYRLETGTNPRLTGAYSTVIWHPAFSTSAKGPAT